MSKDIKKALEHCIEWNCADCPNREELGSGETVCRGRLLPEVLEYVTDLEAKLEESENQCRECKHLNKKIELNIKNKLMAENCELQKQLAEKEKELSEYVKIVDDLHKQLSDKCDFCDKTKDQDKISFAIDKLEKVKENAWQSATDISCLLDYTELAKIIDNQINVLRNNKDGIH